MRQRAKVDANHRDIVYALRKAGASVQSLAAIGKGCPDLLVGIAGRNLVMEVKDGNKPPSGRALTADEQQWFEMWKGKVVIVESVEEALKQMAEEL